MSDSEDDDGGDGAGEVRTRVSWTPADFARGHTIPDTQSLMLSASLPMDLRIVTRDRVGAGGMGVVVRAEDRALLRTIVKKSLLTHLKDDPRSQVLFVREARITGQLEHPNVVPLHYVGVDRQDRLFFTMKLVEGKTLRQMLSERDGPFQHEELLNYIDIVIRICQALGYAHSRGVIHCDVKPSNVMVGDYGQVYLMDWGVAKVLGRGKGRKNGWVKINDAALDELDGAVVGTPSYMPPEQALGNSEAIDERSDVFLVGALLFHLVTGRPPYQGPTVISVLAQAISADHPTLDSLLADDASIPRELRRIIKKSMEPDHEQRYQSIEELRLDLVRFVRGGGLFPRRFYRRGEVIVREGEEGDAGYFIISGRCEVSVERDGEKVFLRTMGAGEAFGETALLSSGTRTASVIASTDVVVEVVTKDIFEREIETMTPWMARFVRTLAERFRGQS